VVWNMQQHGRARLTLVMAWSVALVILAAALYWLGLDKIRDAMRNVSLRILAASLAVSLVATFVRLVKWKLVLGTGFGWRETTRMLFASKAAGGLLPARLGEFAPLASPDYRTAKVSALVIADRAFETYATLLLGAIGIIVLGLRKPALITLWVVVLLTMSIALFLLTYRRLWHHLGRVLLHREWLSRGLALMEKLSSSLQTMGRFSCPLLVLSLAATLLDFLFVQIVFLSVGQPVALPLVAAAWCASVLASVVAFTPSGLGIADLTSVYLYELYGVPAGPLGATVVLVRAITLMLPIVLFLIAFSLGR
jgi:uncharacterized protein (TIRG00374 family)